MFQFITQLLQETLNVRNDLECLPPWLRSFVYFFTEGVDYIGSDGIVTIRPPSCIGCVRVLITDDDIFEERETFFFSFTSDDDEIVVNNSYSHVNVTITDGDGKKNIIHQEFI